MTADVKIPVSADINTTDLEAQLRQFAQQMNSISQNIAKANNVKFNPIDKAAVDDLKRVTSQFQELVKIQAGLRERMKATGQTGRAFGEVDFDRMFPDPAQAHRARVNSYRHVTSGTQFSMPSYSPVVNPSPQPQGVPPPLPGQQAPIAHPRPTIWGSTFPGRVVGGGLRAAGSAGGVAAGALDTGMAAGVGAGVGGLLGGLAALGIGKIISAVSGKVGDAQQEAIGNDTLKRTLGDINVDFVALRENVRAVADGMGMTFSEAQKLATEFAKVAGVTAGTYKSMASELTTSSGFGRSFGLDPSSSTNFFARMRQSGGTSNETDSKRLALNIAEAVGRAGVFTKTDEVLHAVASFSEQVAGSSHTRGNTDAFLGALTGMSGSGLPGMTPNAAASILGRANSAIEGGGAAGEAGQNFLYRGLNRDRKLSPFEVKLMQEGGMFSTRSSVLGKGSLYSQAIGKSFEGSETVFDSIRSQLGANYKDKRLRMMALSNLTGINNSQAMAMDQFVGQHGEGNVGKLADFLKSKKGDLSKVNATGMAALGSIFSGDMGVLKGQAASLQGRTGDDALSAGEGTRLKEAVEKGDKEELRNVLLELTANHEQEKTEGDETRKSITSLSNITQRMSTGLVGPINTMRDALVLMAGDKKVGAAGIAEKVRQIEHDERLSALDSEYNNSKSGYGETIRQLHSRKGVLERARNDAASPLSKNKMTPEEIAASVKQEREIDLQIKDIETKDAAEQADILKRKKKETTSFNSPRGVRNNNPFNIEAGSTPWKGMTGSDGRFAQFDTAESGLRAGAVNLMTKFKRGNNTVAGLIEEWAPASENGAEKTHARIMRMSAELGVKDHDKLKLNDPKVAMAFLRELGRGEVGAGHYTDGQFLDAANAGIGNTPLPANTVTARNNEAAQSSRVHVTTDPIQIYYNDKPAGSTPLKVSANTPSPSGAQ